MPEKLRVQTAPTCRTCPAAGAPRRAGEVAMEGKSAGTLSSGVAQRDTSGHWDRTALGWLWTRDRSLRDNLKSKQINLKSKQIDGLELVSVFSSGFSKMLRKSNGIRFRYF